MPEARVVIASEEFSTGVVTLVTSVGEDAFLEVGGIRTIEEHLLVVVGLDDEVVGCADGFFDLVVRRAAVGDEDETLTHEIDGVAQAIGRVVRDAEGIDLHAKEFEGYAFVEETTGRLEFERDAVVAVDAGMDSGGRVNGEMDMFPEPSDRADMVGVVMRDENPHDVGEVEFHRTQAVVNLTRRDAGIDEDALLLGSEVVAIAGATRTETAKYEMLFRHN